MELREMAEGDLEAVLALNNANVPALGALEDAALRRLVALSAVSLVAEIRTGRGVDEHVAVAGFCIVLPPGVDYDSSNYHWFSGAYADFVYLDRIAVDPAARRRGVGRALYAEVIRRSTPLAPVLLCEVNVRPRNDDSLAFHDQLGFREVGQQDTENGAKRVSLLELPLA